MKIPFKISDNKYVADAKVEIPEQILNHFPSNLIDGYIDIPHVREGSFTRVMGDAALKFTDECTKLDIPAQEYKGIYLENPSEKAKALWGSKKIYIERLGFKERGSLCLWHPVFGDDTSANWIHFDPATDDISYLILRVFNLGWRKRGEKIRMAVKKVLNEV